MTMTGSWSRWFAVGLVAYTIAVGAPPWVSAQQPEDKLEEKGRIRGASRSVLASIGPRRTTSGALPRNRVGRTSSRPVRCLSSSSKTPDPHRADRDARHLEQLARGRRHLVDPVDPKFWYEADHLYAGATLWENVTLGLTYTAYTSPNDSFGTVQELAFGEPER